MPAIIPVVLAAAASFGALELGVAGAIAAGIGFTTSAAAMAVAGLIGSVVAMGASMVMQALMPAAKPKTVEQQAEDRTQLIRGAVEARQVIYGRAVVSGPILYAASSGTDSEFLHLVIAVATHPISHYGWIQINDTIITSDQRTDGSVIAGAMAGKVLIGEYDGTQTGADLTLLAQSPDGWSTDHKLTGIAYLYVRLTYDKDLFPSGLQNIRAEVFGKSDIYDPRTGTTGWTENWSLCVRDYLLSEWGPGATTAELDDASFQAAANLSDEQVQMNAEATEFQGRYVLNGAFKLDAKPIDICDQMMTAGCGVLVYVQGVYRLYGGAYASPTLTLGPSDFAGDLEVVTAPPARDRFNATRGTFVDPEHGWQASEFVPYSDAAAVAADGAELWKDFQFPFTIQDTMAQRLARQMLKISRHPIRVKAPVKYHALRAAVWQVVGITHADFGWTSKPFRVEGFSFDPSTGAVSLALREEIASAYSWTYDAAQDPLPAEETTLISPLDIPAPTGLTLTPTTSLQADGTTTPALLAQWTPSAHAFVNAHELQWAVSGGAWNSREVAAGTNRYVIPNVVSGTAYDARVRAVAGLVRSAWSTIASSTGGHDTTAPGLPTGMVAVGVARGISVYWTKPSDPDFAYVEVVESVGEFGPYTKVGESAGSVFLRTGLNAGDTMWFALRSVDRSGNASNYTTVFNGTAVLTQTADITNSAVTTGKVASGAVTGNAAMHTTTGLLTVSAPLSGYNLTVITDVTITLDGDNKAMIFSKAPNVTWNLVGGDTGGGGGDGSGGGDGGGGDGGGGGGE